MLANALLSAVPETRVHALQGSFPQVADLRKKIEDEQRMLMQWSEERLALAQSLSGLLELHAKQATNDIAAFDSELQVGVHAACSHHSDCT